MAAYPAYETGLVVDNTTTYYDDVLEGAIVVVWYRKEFYYLGMLQCSVRVAPSTLLIALAAASRPT